MNYLAIDLGAESGRVILGTLASGRIKLEEVHRVPNGPVMRGNSLHWDLEKLWLGILDGLQKVAARNVPVAGISADSWGVDYVLDGDISNVFHYRDARGKRGVERMLALMKWEEIFEETGIQFMPINTLFQLAAETRSFGGNGLILSVADFFNQQLGGEPVIEESMASTFQIYNPRQKAWSRPLLEHLRIPLRKFGRVVKSGTPLGPISKKFANGSLRQTQIVATCSHDTGAAVAAAPAEPDSKWAYLSSGTWSLMGVERSEPIINPLARELNFTNEIGFGSSIRLLKNISGLWLLQECRRIWAKEGRDLDYAELTRLAANEPAFGSIVNPADERFLAPVHMPGAIASYCKETGQPVPQTPAAFTRCIFESLALLYRKTLLQLEQLTGNKIEVLHIVGGGSKNGLLNQFTADACGVDVIAGPVEATALGNILIQAIALGEVADLARARGLVRLNFETTRFKPADSFAWPAAFQRFEALPI